ncbi:MAG: gamma-glutamyl-gamma-aminobutyrate hydrolase family protein [Dokdonella sp.]
MNDAAHPDAELPRIALAPRSYTGDVDAAGAWRKQQTFFERSLQERLTAAGGLVIGTCLPAEADVATRLASAYARQCSGLILQGGTDIGGASSANTSSTHDTSRDFFEIALVRAFLQLDKPILGICRGMQLINVAFGGSLVAMSDAQASRHSDPSIYTAHAHPIELTEAGYLAILYGCRRGRVNTAHRQAVQRIGQSLCIEAVCADDSSVEALRSRVHRHVLGVQWHPEFDIAIPDRLDGDRLLRDFVARCAVR